MRAEIRGPGGRVQLEFLEVAARLVLLGTPVFYTLGRVFSDGYWNELGVSPSLMGASVEDYVFLGLIVIVNGLVLILPSSAQTPWWVGPVLSICLVMVLAFNLWLLVKVKSWLRPKLRQLGYWLRRYLARRRVASETLSMTSTVTGAIGAVLFAFFVCAGALLLPVVLAHSVGALQAQRLAERLRDGEHRFAEVSSPQLNGESARLIECSDQYCIVYTQRGIVPLLRSSISWQPIELKKVLPGS